MTCNEFETRFLVGEESPAPTAERAPGEAHLADCAGCQALTRQLLELDAALADKVKTPVLSADFNQRLAKRIQIEAPGLSAAQQAERRQQLQAEYEAGREQLRRSSQLEASLLERLPYVALAALAGWLAWQFTPGWLNLLAAQGLSGAGQTLLLAAVAGAVFLTIGLAAAFPRTFRQLWSLS